MSENLGHDFNLPDEILSVIPTDPYDQLDLARKITSMAIASRVSNLENDTGRLKQSLSEKDKVIVKLQERVAELEDACQDVQVQLRIATEDNMKLVRERDSFAMTAKKLSRDLAKLETFKRQLMQSLSEDDSSQAETVDIEQIPKAYPTTEENNGYMIQRSLSGSTDSSTITDALVPTGQRVPLTPSYITPRLTPTATPKVYSTNGSPRRYSSMESPQIISGATSPTKSQYDGRASLSSWYPSSQQSSAASSPPRGRSTTARTPRIDGKEFFRQARSRLSYEQFSAFLANIKELNAQKQTREETLRKAEEIFGTDNKDLYLLFQGLLNRNTKS
ncbi:uncharacterized protein At4g15545-like isoform X1 [Apium graveolens]|uniref:uncharacterized protein At4g15545-like isoform X1 n=1 Tax=Apium graveolens TaxID=4045 RepID=UPI003D78D100